MAVEPKDETLVQSLVGRRIDRAVWIDESPNYDWAGHELAILWLDDGRAIQFSAWGYDAWGATVSDVTDMPGAGEPIVIEPTVQEVESDPGIDWTCQTCRRAITEGDSYVVVTSADAPPIVYHGTCEP